ncbi:outer membrane protein assembly factor [Bacteroidales bacterium OttesenSCG-928-J19]|nr:outer membrane protein assembly factor [Bacteroidales bacterium OttesenSCG-928-J19]
MKNKSGQIDRSTIGCLFALLALCLMTACGSVTRFVPDGQYLLEKVDLKVEGDGPSATELLPYIQQTPANNFEVKIYNSVDTPSGWWRNIVRKMGAPGVIFRNSLVGITESELLVQMKNLGYLAAEVTSQIDTLNKKAQVRYTITPNDPYHVREYKLDIPITRRQGSGTGMRGRRPEFRQDSLHRVEQDTTRRLGIFRRQARNPRLIKEGDLFDMNLLEQERQRVNRQLLNMGYYGSNLNNLHYWADTTLRSNQVDLKLGVLDSTRMIPYTIERVNIYSGYSPMERRSYAPTDSTERNGINIYWDKMHFLRPGVIEEKILVRPKQRYRVASAENTYNLLKGLNCVGRVDVQYAEKNYADSTLLDCNIYLTPGNIHSLQMALEGTNKDGDIGVALDATYGHLNLFNGSEVFNINMRAAYEFVRTNENSPLGNNYYELGVKPSLVFPKLHIPWVNSLMKNNFTTQTEYSLGYNMQKRPEFMRNFFNWNWRYRWTGHKQNISHNLSLLDINYVIMPWKSDKFVQYLNNEVDSLTKYSYNDIFTAGITYGFSYSNKNTGKGRQHLYTIRFNMETSGNLLNWLGEEFNWEKNSEGQHTILGNPLAQYVKGDFDISQTFQINPENSIAFRFGVGAAYPYKNSSVLPFEKRYYGGGPNHVRGWDTRYLGPGSYSRDLPNERVFHVGDINLISSLEYRFKAMTWLEPALFVDAGNIWTIKEYANQPGGKFEWNSFYKELAVGAGIGFRLDLSFLILRLDLATRIMDPARPEGDRLVLFKDKFFPNSNWYIAIGYPF